MGKRTIAKRDSDQLSMLLSKSKSCTRAQASSAEEDYVGFFVDD